MPKYTTKETKQFLKLLDQMRHNKFSWIKEGVTITFGGDCEPETIPVTKKDLLIFIKQYFQL